MMHLIQAEVTLQNILLERIKTSKACLSVHLNHSDAGWSSLVARRAHNPKVVSSNLAPATNSKYSKIPLAPLTT